MAELSNFAWALLDLLNCSVTRLAWDKVAPGPRDALVAIGAAEKTQTAPARPYGRHKSMPAKHEVFITEHGRKLLAEWKAANRT